MNTFKPICIIPAKESSKRLPKKNILKICGKSLITYVIEAAQKSNLFSQIIVSTESKAVANIASKSNVAIHSRDNHLSHDPYGIVDVVLDVLRSNKSYKQHEFISVVLPTSPLIEDTDIVNAYEIFNTSDVNSLFSITKSAHTSYRSIIVKDGVLTPIFKDKFLKKSQDLETTYEMNAGISFFKTDNFLQEKSYFCEPIGVYVLSQEKSVDIDTQFDFDFATFLMERRLRRNYE